MKKGWKIFLIILLCIVLAVGCVVYFNWNTVMGVIDGLRYSEEDVVRKQEENKQELQKFLDENKDVTVRDLTDEENQALASGEISEEDAVKIITGTATLDDVKKQNGDVAKPPEPAENGSTVQAPSGTEAPPVTKPEPSGEAPSVPVNPPAVTPAPEPEKTSDQIISELIATLYVQKSVYLSRLDNLESTLGAEFEKVPKNEKGAEKKRIIAKYMPVIIEWEKTCDGVVYGILDQIEAELIKSGKDLSIIDKIDEAYKNEKRLKKAYYINNYMS